MDFTQLIEVIRGANLPQLIEQVGLIGLSFIVFAESGLFFGFFLPGDSLLFTAGLLASQGLFNIFSLILILPLAAILGDSVGYFTGKRFGDYLKNKNDNIIYKKRYITEAEKFYARHGGKAIVLARFVPAVRTFVPIVAGIAKMDYSNFVFYNIIGGLFWAVGMTLTGYYLGQIIPDVDKYLLPIVIIIIILSVLPGVVHLRKSNQS